MILKHTTHRRKVESIFKEGIQLNQKPVHEDITQGYVYLEWIQTAIPIPSEEDYNQWVTDYPIINIWGDYHFFVNGDFIREHSEQFREYKSSSRSNQFISFLKQFNIQKANYICCGMNDDSAKNQVISLDPIPVDALCSLVILDTSRFSEPSKSEITDILAKVPEHMEVYAGINPSEHSSNIHPFRGIERLK